MARLTAATRNALPGRDFAGPGRSYPDDTPNRARNALSRVSEYGSPAVKAEVRANVHEKYPSIGQERRNHALTIASATHLHKAGHLPAAQKAHIHSKARASLNRLKGEPKHGAGHYYNFGSLAPEMDEGQ